MEYTDFEVNTIKKRLWRRQRGATEKIQRFGDAIFPSGVVITMSGCAFIFLYAFSRHNAFWILISGALTCGFGLAFILISYVCDMLILKKQKQVEQEFLEITRKEGE